MQVLLAIIKAIPGIITLINIVKDVWDKWEMSQIKKHYEAKRKVRAKLTEQLNNAKTLEEKKSVMEIIALLDSNDDPVEL